MSETYAEFFAARLREALGTMNQADLLKLYEQNGISMTQQRLSHYMNGRNYPDPPVLKDLAKLLGVSADWLLGLTEQNLPADDLNEMAAQAKGEGRLNKVMRQLGPDTQKQVILYAEYLLSRQGYAGAGSDLVAEESRRISAESAKWLDSIERLHGLKTRIEVEKMFRDKNILVDSTP